MTRELRNLRDIHRSIQAAFGARRFDLLSKECASVLNKVPDDVVALGYLARASMETGNLGGAYKLYEKIAAITDNGDDYVDVATIAYDTGRVNEAKTYALNAFSRLGDVASDKLVALGILLTKLDKCLPAKGVFEVALVRGVDDPSLNYHAAVNLKYLGEFSQALTYLRQCLDIPDLKADAYFEIIDIDPSELSDQDVEALENIADADSFSVRQRQKANWALYRVNESRSSYAKAFSYLRVANKLQLSIIGSSRNNVVNYDDIMKLFSKKQGGGVGALSEAPIFVVGQPRSGTTLVECILASHSSVSPGGELPHLRQSLSPLLSQFNSQMNIDKVLRGQNLRASDLGEYYLSRVKDFLEYDGEYFVDKAFQNYTLIGFIKMILPKAKIVIVTRAPEDGCFSLYRQFFVPEAVSLHYTNSLRDICRHQVEYRRFIDFWLKKFPDQLFELNYEELVEKPEQSVRSLAKYCGLDYQPQMLDFHENRATVTTASATQIRSKITPRYVGRWEKYKGELQEYFAKFSE